MFLSRILGNISLYFLLPRVNSDLEDLGNNHHSANEALVVEREGCAYVEGLGLLAVGLRPRVSLDETLEHRGINEQKAAWVSSLSKIENLSQLGDSPWPHATHHDVAVSNIMWHYAQSEQFEGLGLTEDWCRTLAFFHDLGYSNILYSEAMDLSQKRLPGLEDVDLPMGFSVPYRKHHIAGAILIYMFSEDSDMYYVVANHYYDQPVFHRYSSEEALYEERAFSASTKLLTTADRLAGMGWIGLLRQVYYHGFRDRRMEMDSLEMISNREVCDTEWPPDSEDYSKGVEEFATSTLGEWLVGQDVDVIENLMESTFRQIVQYIGYSREQETQDESRWKMIWDLLENESDLSVDNIFEYWTSPISKAFEQHVEEGNGDVSSVIHDKDSIKQLAATLDVWHFLKDLRHRC